MIPRGEVSPALAAYTQALSNSHGGHEEVAKHVQSLPGTSGDGRDQARAKIVLDWLIRTAVPAWLEAAGSTEEAASLRELKRICDASTLRHALHVLDAARAKIGAAMRTAQDAACAAWGGRVIPAADKLYIGSRDSIRAATAAIHAVSPEDSDVNFAAYVASDVACDAAYIILWSVACSATPDESLKASQIADRIRPAFDKRQQPVAAHLRASAVELLAELIPVTPVN